MSSINLAKAGLFHRSIVLRKSFKVGCLPSSTSSCCHQYSSTSKAPRTFLNGSPSANLSPLRRKTTPFSLHVIRARASSLDEFEVLERELGISLFKAHVAEPFLIARRLWEAEFSKNKTLPLFNELEVIKSMMKNLQVALDSSSWKLDGEVFKPSWRDDPFKSRELSRLASYLIRFHLNESDNSRQVFHFLSECLSRTMDRIESDDIVRVMFAFHKQNKANECNKDFLQHLCNRAFTQIPYQQPVALAETAKYLVSFSKSCPDIPSSKIRSAVFNRLGSFVNQFVEGNSPSETLDSVVLSTPSIVKTFLSNSELWKNSESSTSEMLAQCSVLANYVSISARHIFERYTLDDGSLPSSSLKFISLRDFSGTIETLCVASGVLPRSDSIATFLNCEYIFLPILRQYVMAAASFFNHPSQNRTYQEDLGEKIKILQSLQLLDRNWLTFFGQVQTFDLHDVSGRNDLDAMLQHEKKLIKQTISKLNV
jgi:hypothetical protein